MTPQDIEDFLLTHFDDVYPINSWGERSFFLNPGRRLKRGTYFATIKSKDGENDKASDLDRPGVFRLNMGISKPLFLSHFTELPKRPAKGGVIEMDFDFTALDTLMPHPVYGWMAWVNVLNPSPGTFESCIPLLDDAYKKAYGLSMRKLKA